MRNRVTTMRTLVALGLTVGMLAVSAPGAAAARPSSDGGSNVVWTAVDGPTSPWLIAVPGGYVASTSCWDLTPPTIYTSPDGIVWTTPPDPSIFATADEGFCVTGFEPAAGPAGYLLAGPVVDGETTIWQSSDGVRWTRNGVPSLYGTELSEIAPTRTGYLAADSSHDNYWTSTDGIEWTPAAFDAFKLKVGQPGEPMVAGGEGGFSWFSLDGGLTWSLTGTPRNQKLLVGVGRLGKLYYGDWEMGGVFKLYWTRDMRHWAPLHAPIVNPGSLQAFGGRLYVVEYGDTYTTGTVFSTADGRNWSAVKDAAGQPIQANALSVVGGRLFVSDGSTIVWVGSLS